MCVFKRLTDWQIDLMGEIDCTRYCHRDSVDASSAVCDEDGQKVHFSFDIRWVFHSFFVRRGSVKPRYAAEQGHTLMPE